MATLTFSVASAAVTGSKAFTLSDADITRWLNQEKLRYGSGPQTPAQILLNWAAQCMAEAQARTLAGEQAAAIAAANLTPIVAS